MVVTYYEPQAKGARSTVHCDGGGPRERLEFVLAEGAKSRIWINEYSAGALLAHVDFLLAPGNSLQLLGDSFTIVSGVNRHELKIVEIRAAIADPAESDGARLASLRHSDLLSGGSWMRVGRDGKAIGRADNRFEVALRGSVPAADAVSVAYPRLVVNGKEEVISVPFRRKTEGRLVVNC